MKILEFLKEDNNRFSNARLLALLSVLTFVIDWHVHLWSGREFEPSFTLVGFVLGAVGLKVIQKFSEAKSGKINETSMSSDTINDNPNLINDNSQTLNK